MWPLSVYSPLASLPRRLLKSIELSAEELRMQYYLAQAAGNPQEYVSQPGDCEISDPLLTCYRSNKKRRCSNELIKRSKLCLMTSPAPDDIFSMVRTRLYIPPMADHRNLLLTLRHNRRPIHLGNSQRSVLQPAHLIQHLVSLQILEGRSRHLVRRPQSAKAQDLVSPRL